MPTEKIRLDELLLELGLAPDIERARSLILSGSVLVNDVVVNKAGLRFSNNSSIRIKEMINEYVSRGAYKLKPVLEKWNISIADQFCVDLGASTGGFTQVLLEKNAKQVYCVDVGYGQLAGKLRNNPKVKIFDRTHIKNLRAEDFPKELDEIFFTMDLSFISLKNVFPHILELSNVLKLSMKGLSLLKPQFEANPKDLEKGILKNRNMQFFIIKDMIRFLKKDFEILGITNSPLKGTEGNQEFFIYWKLERK